MMPSVNGCGTARQAAPRFDRTYLSYSAISTYQACPLRFFFRYMMGLPEETVSASLVFGSAVHAAVQFHFENLLAGNTASGLDALLGVFHDAWHAHEQPTIQFGKREGFDTYCRLADSTLRAFLATDWAFPKGRILGVEEELRGDVVPGCPELLGRVDLVVDHGDYVELTDFKTSRNGWSDSHVQEAAPQVLLYGELARPLADGKPLRLSFAVMTKTQTPSLSVHHVDANPQIVDRTKAVVKRVWNAIAAGHFYPSPSALNCAGCPFREPCQRWLG
jgi:putative RecB family exonuclease